MMRSLYPFAIALSLLSLVSPSLSFGRSSQQQAPGRDAILLSNVQALTLRGNRLTSSRRVAPIPQLKCTGPSKRICDLYQVETMRCTNEGYDYDVEDVQWTCTAPLPPEFKLGATDVVCEGYRNADDKWVLKGSCGVEYRLLLTELGEKRFGRLRENDRWTWEAASNHGWRRIYAMLANLLFFGFTVGAFVMIFLPMIADCLGLRRNRRGPRLGRGWGGFWGGGGGGDDDRYNPGPPPPYSCSDDSSSRPWTSSQGWRPGFWTGALGGAAAGYQFGRSQAYGSPFRGRRATSFQRYDGYDAGEGSSQRHSSPRFSATTTSTGFGSTRRR